jgi:HAMP domain-containing protein
MTQTPTKTPSLPWYQRIGHRIIAVAVFSAFLPILILGLTIGVKFRRDLVQQAMHSQIALTGAIQNGIDSLLRSYERQVRALALNPDIQPVDRHAPPGTPSTTDRQREAIYEFLDINPIFYSGFIYDAEGNVTSLALRNRYRGLDAKYLGRNVLRTKSENMESTRQVFQQVVRTGTSAFTGHIVSASQQKTMLMMVPIPHFVDQTKVVGVISCAINLEGPEMMELIREYPLVGGDILLLVDQSGGLIAARGEGLPEGLTGVALDFERLRTEPTRAVEFPMNGQPYLGIVTRVPVLNSYLIAARPRREVLGFLHRILFDLMLVLSIAVVLAVGFGYALSRTLAEQVNRLLEGIRLVSDGVMNHRVRIEGEDELAQACAAFNDMVATLEKNRLMDEIWTREWEKK